MSNQLDIKMALKDKGLTQVDIANILKVKPPTVHNVITGKRSNPRIRKAISLAVNKPISDLWPDKEQV